MQICCQAAGRSRRTGSLATAALGDEVNRELQHSRAHAQRELCVGRPARCRCALSHLPQLRPLPITQRREEGIHHLTRLAHALLGELVVRDQPREREQLLLLRFFRARRHQVRRCAARLG